jgi:hypothetical protein
MKSTLRPGMARMCWVSVALKDAAGAHIVFRKRYASKSGFLRAEHEAAYLLAKGEVERPALPISDVLEWRYTGNRLHPTRKPVEVLTPLIEAFSRPGAVVLDPTHGDVSRGRHIDISSRRHDDMSFCHRFATGGAHYALCRFIRFDMSTHLH